MCININHPFFDEIRGKVPLGFITAEIESNPNITSYQIYNRYIFKLQQQEDGKIESETMPLKGNEKLYKEYNLLTSDGKIKVVPKKDSVKWLETLNKSKDHSFVYRKTPSGSKIFIINKPKTVQAVLFNEKGKAKNNLSKYFDSNVSDSQTILRKIAKQDNGLGTIAKQLLKNSFTVPIEIVDVDTFTKGNLPEGVFFHETLGKDFRAAAFYDPNAKKIYVAKNVKFKDSTEGTLIHEILHAYTNHYIRNNNNTVTQNLEKLMNHVKSPEIYDTLSDKYPLTNLDEFVVAIFTNPSFIKDLQRLEPINPNFVSIWDNILHLFKVIFGVSDKTLFDEVFAAGSALVEETQAQLQDYEDNFEIDFVLPNQAGDERQTMINRKLDELQQKVSKVNEQYIVNGVDVNWKRASAVAKQGIQTSFKGVKTDSQLEIEGLYQEAGTILHGIQANIIKEAFPDYNRHLEKFLVPEEAEEFISVMREQLKPIIAKAKERGSVLKAEVFVGNTKSEKAGTIDLLEITNEGNYYVYDLKTRFTEDKSGKRRINKIIEWSEQTQQYNDILVAGDPTLGIVKGKIEGTYVLELAVEVKDKTMTFNGNVSTRTNAGKFLSRRKLTKIVTVAPTFLRTKDDKINDTIERLLVQVNNLRKQKEKNPDAAIINDEILRSKIDLLQDLQLREDVAKLIDHGYIELYDIEKMIEEGGVKNNSQFIKEQIQFYQDIIKNFEDLPQELEYKLLKLQKLANSLEAKYEKFKKDTMKEAAEKNGVLNQLGKIGKEFFGAVTDINWLSRMTLGVSGIDNPIIQSAYRTVRDSLGRAREKTQKTFDKIKEVTDKFKADGHSFDLLIEGDSLVGQYEKDFWVKKNTAERNNDAEWFDENVSFDKESYQKARDRQLDFFDAYREVYKKAAKVGNEELSEADLDLLVNKQIADRMVSWEKANKGNKSKYFIPFKKWTNPKWQDIKEGKYKGTSVEETYDLFTSFIESANEIMPDKVKKNFIPNFLKSYTDRLADNNGLGFFQNGLINAEALEAKYDEGQFGKRDSVTGEILNQLYIPGIETIENKSLDLPVAFFKFMEGIYRYEELREVENLVLATKDYLRKDATFYATNVLGKKIDIIDNIKQNSNISQAYDAWVDGIFYGKKKKDDHVFEVKGNGFTKLLLGIKKGDTKKISVAKIVDKFIQYTTLRNLGFNLYSPIVNLTGGTLNMYMTGASGKYYNSEDLTKAMGLSLGGITNFPNEDVKKARLIIEWLNLNTGEFQRSQEAALSSNRATKILNKYNAMSLMSVSEDVMRDAGGLAMVISGKHGYKWEDFNVVDGELKINTDLLTKENFRQKAIKINQMNIGGINSDDMMEAKQYIVGRLLMQHRSWLPALAAKRFGKRKYDWTMDEEIEGRYITTFRAFKMLWTKQKYSTLSQMEKDNLKEAGVELAMIIGTTLLLALLKGATDDDDKKKAWYKIADKVSDRSFSELTFFVDPTFKSQYQVLLKPAAAAGTVEDFGRFIGSIYKDMYGTKEQQKRAQPVKRGLKMVPGVNKVESFLNDLGYTE